MKQVFKSISSLTGRPFKLYRSSDETGTAKFWSAKQEKAFFEILIFDYKYGCNEVYVRYPGTEHFIETTGGHKSVQGSMIKGSGENPWHDDYRKKFEFYIHDKNMMFKEFNHNFLVKVNDEEALRIVSDPQLNYLELPHDVIEISYAHRLGDMFFVIFNPKYNFTYRSSRMIRYSGTNCEELKIQKFERYRDGGTTEVVAADHSGTEHIFYYPTPFKKDICPTYNGISMEEMSEEQVKIAKILIDSIILKEQ